MTKFGVAGNSRSFFDDGYSKTIEAAKWCQDRGIELFEYSFGRGLTMNNATAKLIGKEFMLYNIELSVHAPYFINFANTDEMMIAKSIAYVTKSIEKVKCFGGNRVIFHPAAQGKLNRNDAIAICKENLKKLILKIEENPIEDVKIFPETMGKLGQIGTVDEIIEFCNMADYIYPCMDFGHINARQQGCLKSVKDYDLIITKMLDNLPSEKVKNMHIHFSKIQYGPKGEIKHLTFQDETYGPNFQPLAEILTKYTLSPNIICESNGTQAEDAIEMKEIYYKTLTK